MITYPSFEVKERIKIKRIYSFFEHDFENGYRFSGEMHNFWECVCVTRGKICAIADENVYDMKAGEKAPMSAFFRSKWKAISKRRSEIKYLSSATCKKGSLLLFMIMRQGNTKSHLCHIHRTLRSGMSSTKTFFEPSHIA